MIVAKLVADLITWTRVVISLLLAWMGTALGAKALPVVVICMIANWTGDMLDGSLARRSKIRYTTWIGDHDLQVDMFVSIGLLFFLLESGYTSVWQILLYAAFWLVIFKIFGIAHSLGMLFQAPIYGLFIWVAMRDAPIYGRWIVIFLVGMIILTWPRFPKMVVPGFLSGMRQAFGPRKRTNG